MPMDAAKTWQGAPPTAFKPKKAFIPRLVRSNRPDHVIGASAVLQVGCGVGCSLFIVQGERGV